MSEIIAMNQLGGYDNSNFESPEFTNNDFLLLNIGGTSYRLRPSTIHNRLKNSRLGKFILLDNAQKGQSCDGFILHSGEWFFERSFKLFEPVYKFYITGTLHRPMDICIQEFVDELQFWEIPKTAVSACCWPKFSEKEEHDDEFKDLWEGERRKYLWNFCDGSGSIGSTILSCVSIGFVLVSMLGLTLSSLHEFQVPLNASNESETTEMVPHPAFDYLQYVCFSWFTLEYIIRFVIAPKKLAFLKSFLNLIDLLAIVPFFIERLLLWFAKETVYFQNFKGLLLVIRVLRVFRVFRILKLGRFSTGMRMLGLAMKASAKQLFTMIMVLGIGVIFFSTAVYFVEKNEPDTPFTSIPAGFWWSVVTMTTVGYGDVVPGTSMGKLVASMAILCGVLVMALPITILVEHYMSVSGNTKHTQINQSTLLDTKRKV